MLTYRKAELKERQAIEDFVKGNLRKFARRFYVNPIFQEKAIAEYIVKDILEKMQNGTALWACNGTAMKGLSIVSESDWDSEILGKNVGKLGLYTILSPAETGHFLKETCSKLAQTELDVLFGRVQIETAKRSLRAILADNAILGDLLVTLGKNICGEESSPEVETARRSDLVFENGKATDEEQLKKITASAYKQSHYFNDPNIPLDKAEAVYQKWISSSLRGFADSVIVARANEKTVGYITLRTENLGQRAFGIIDLIAVREGYRGQGIAKMLIAEEIRQFHDRIETLYVKTQVSNLPALRLYYKLGFEPILREATFHVWLKTLEEPSDTPLSSRPTPAQSLSKAEVPLTSTKMKTVVISQPTYLPWLGFFRIMKEADVFVFLDHVQYVRQSWQCRNRIKSPRRWIWLTVPITHAGFCPIKDTLIDDSEKWQKAHLKTLEMFYQRAPYFKDHHAFFRSVYEKKWKHIAELNIYLIQYLASQLDLSPVFVRSSELNVEGKRTQMVFDICRKLGASRYVASIGAMEYMKSENASELFGDQIQVQFLEYRHPSYPQLFGEFVPGLAFVDCLFNNGPESARIVFGENTAIFHTLGSKQITSIDDRVQSV